MNDRTTNRDGTPNAEPALTQKNTETIKGEEQLVDDTSVEDQTIDVPGGVTADVKGVAGRMTPAGG